MARELLSCGPEHIYFLHSTLYNYHLCKLMQDFLSKKGKLLCISPHSLQWDWANSYGLNPCDLVEDLLAKQFGATVERVEVENKDLFTQLFAKFPLGTVDEKCQFMKITLPNYQFSTTYKFVKDTESEDYYFGQYEEEKRLHVACFDSTIVFAHPSYDFSELNYAFILRTLFNEMEGMEQ
ncbi:hypothetical protein D7X33_20200 [Butyricicoccus sp. 1XD8-22]|nr:hypothetical protein D7X33_20200 [Butyricicoccus sp. 1XD8-22]